MDHHRTLGALENTSVDNLRKINNTNRCTFQHVTTLAKSFMTSALLTF